MSLNLPNVCLIIGIITLCFSLNFFIKTKKILSNSIKTQGMVIKNIIVTNSSSINPTYTPVFKYNNNSEDVIFESPVSSYPATYKLGDKVDIIVSKQNKTEIKIESFWGLYRLSVILLALASPFLSIGVTYYLYTLTN